ncbi:hypothetical protein KAZ82_00765, partial [Candidatus Babeliales bacterium]|nr:hypothetical protein [Candidatus Babeliales bacterium]
IECGANVDAMNNRGYTALDLAILNKKGQIIRKLLEVGARIPDNLSKEDIVWLDCLIKNINANQFESRNSFETLKRTSSEFGAMAALFGAETKKNVTIVSTVYSLFCNPFLLASEILKQRATDQAKLKG